MTTVIFVDTEAADAAEADAGGCHEEPERGFDKERAGDEADVHEDPAGQQHRGAAQVDRRRERGKGPQAGGRNTAAQTQCKSQHKTAAKTQRKSQHNTAAQTQRKSQHNTAT